MADHEWYLVGMKKGDSLGLWQGFWWGRGERWPSGWFLLFVEVEGVFGEVRRCGGGVELSRRGGALLEFSLLCASGVVSQRSTTDCCYAQPF